MYGLLGCNYLKIESEGAKKNLNIEKIAFKVVQMKFLAMQYYWSKIKFWYIYGKKCTKYLHVTWSLLNILMIFGIKEKCIILTHMLTRIIDYCHKYTPAT